MYEGMSYVQLYRNRAMTRTIPQDASGNYALDIGVISNNAHSPYTFNVYAKNIGTHKAYDVNITILNGNATTTFVKQDIPHLGFKTIPFSITLNKNQTIQEIIMFSLEFDSV